MQNRILMFDDDPTYALTIERQARSMDIEAIICQTMEDFCLRALEGAFDVALIDYHLDNFKGCEVARVIENRPIVLMSMDKTIVENRLKWPKGIAGFVSKRSKTSDVLGTALHFASHRRSDNDSTN